MNISPGGKTTEFWMTSITAILGLLMSLGYIEHAQSEVLTKNIQTIIGAIITIAPVLFYIYSRAKVKINGLLNVTSQGVNSESIIQIIKAIEKIKKEKEEPVKEDKEKTIEDIVKAVLENIENKKIT